MQPIKISSISEDATQYGKKITIIDGKLKYSFFDSKRDGNKTKAFEQYEKYGYRIGDTISAEVKEEEKTFTNDKGKQVTFTQRTILYFEEVENTPTFGKNTPPAPSNDKFEQIMFKLEDIEAKIGSLVEFIVEENKNILEAINSREPKI